MSSFASWIALLTAEIVCSIVLLLLLVVSLSKVVEEYRNVLDGHHNGSPMKQGRNKKNSHPNMKPSKPVQQRRSPPLQLNAVRSNSANGDSPPMNSTSTQKKKIMKPSMKISIDTDTEIPEQIELDYKGSETRIHQIRLEPLTQLSVLSETPSSSTPSATPQSRKPFRSRHGSVSSSRRRGSSLSVSSAQQMADRKDPKTFLLWFSLKLSTVCFCFSVSTVIMLFTLLNIGFGCKMSSKISAVFFQIGKGTAFSIYVDRVRTVFRGSKLEYSSKTLDLMSYFIWISTLGYSAAWFLIVTNRNSPVEGVKWAIYCRLHVIDDYALLPLAGLLTEIVIEVSTLNMFTVPLRKLIKRLVKIDESTKDMAQLASKTNVLTCVMVISMILSISSIIITDHFVSAPISAVIFCVCLLLFPHWYDEWYPVLCYLPIMTIEHCCGRVPIHEMIHPSEFIQSVQKQINELSLSNPRSRSRSKH